MSIDFEKSILKTFRGSAVEKLIFESNGKSICEYLIDCRAQVN
jgi:hypothetical protein